MSAWVTALIRILAAFVEEVRRLRRQTHMDAVRADPAGEWLRRFGGTDRRSASGPENAGSDHHE